MVTVASGRRKPRTIAAPMAHGQAPGTDGRRARQRIESSRLRAPDASPMTQPTFVRHCVAAITTLALLNAPAQAQSSAPAAAESAQAVVSGDFQGFSIDPPADAEWRLTHRGPNGLAFVRQLFTRTHSAALVASRARLPHSVAIASQADFFEYVRRSARERIDPKRHRLVEEWWSADQAPAPNCQRFRLRVMDRGPGAKLPEPSPFDIEGVACSHPDSLRTLIEVSWSERGGPGPGSDQVRAAGEAFVQSLRFRPLE